MFDLQRERRKISGVYWFVSGLFPVLPFKYWVTEMHENVRIILMYHNASGIHDSTELYRARMLYTQIGTISHVDLCAIGKTERFHLSQSILDAKIIVSSSTADQLCSRLLFSSSSDSENCTDYFAVLLFRYFLFLFSILHRCCWREKKNSIHRFGNVLTHEHNYFQAKTRQMAVKYIAGSYINCAQITRIPLICFIPNYELSLFRLKLYYTFP